MMMMMKACNFFKGTIFTTSGDSIYLSDDRIIPVGIRVHV